MARVNKVKKTCENCHNEFETLFPTQRTCSRSCGYILRSKEKRKGKIVNCDWCGKPIYKEPSRIRKYNFCSPDHQHKFNKKDPNMSKGWHQSEETIKKIRQARLGKPRNFSIQALENIRKAARARKGKWTDTQKERLRQVNLGKKYSLEVNASKASKGKKNGMWKGNKASYQAKHMWIYVREGKPKQCKDCGITSDERKIEWSNVDHKYKRNLDDYVGRCVPCHRKYDVKNGYRAFGRKIV